MTAFVTSDETYRDLAVCDPDSEELSTQDAVRIATDSLDEPELWTTRPNHERINYNRVRVRFQLL